MPKAGEHSNRDPQLSNGLNAVVRSHAAKLLVGRLVWGQLPAHELRTQTDPNNLGFI